MKTLADVPMADDVPRGGVVKGPRNWRWIPTVPATIAYAEALDGGNPKTKVEFRDKVMTLAAPFNGSPAELTKTAFRFQSVAWTSGGSIWLTENDRDSRKVRTWVMDAPGATPRKLFERSSEDSYNNPGTPLRSLRGSGTEVVFQNGDNVFMTGVGSSPKGDRPFLDRFNIKTGAKERHLPDRRSNLRTGAGAVVRRWIAIHHAGSRRGPRRRRSRCAAAKPIRAGR